MIDIHQFGNEVLSLVDSNPRNAVDIIDLIKKYTNGQEISIQQETRQLICSELINLKKAEEINYVDSEMSQLLTLNSSSFLRDFLSIKSTYERQKKLKNEVFEKRINELTLEALERDSENAALKKQLDEAGLRLSKAQYADIPINAEDRKTVIIWQVIAGISAAVAFLLKLFGVKGWL